MTDVDPTVERFHNHSDAATECLWPIESGKYTNKEARTTLNKRFTYWWGAMQIAIEMVADRERERGLNFEARRLRLFPRGGRVA